MSNPFRDWLSSETGGDVAPDSEATQLTDEQRRELEERAADLLRGAYFGSDAKKPNR